jgi:hypothetical protein
MGGVDPSQPINQSTIQLRPAPRPQLTTFITQFTHSGIAPGLHSYDICVIIDHQKNIAMKGKFITTDIRLAALSAKPRVAQPQPEKNERLARGIFKIFWTKEERMIASFPEIK